MLEDRNSDIFFLPQKHQSDETEARMAVDKKAWRSSNEQERHYSRRLFLRVSFQPCQRHPALKIISSPVKFTVRRCRLPCA
jgi:hypothetical protein